MRAIVFDNGLRFVPDRPEPRPGPGEALIRVTLAGVCATDIEITKGYMGFSGIPGHEFSGVIEEASDDRFIGKRVAGEINIACGRCDYCRARLPRHCPSRKVLGISGKDGAFADYITLPFKNLHPIPDNISDEEAVFIEPLASAFEILEQVRINEDTRVCVVGDGRLGLLVAQALSLSDCALIVIGRHEDKLSLLEARGIPVRTGAEGLERTMDVVVDCTGSVEGARTALELVRPCGTLVVKSTVAAERTLDLNRIVIDEITVVGSRCGPFQGAIKAIEERRVELKPLVTKVFPLEEGVTAIGYAGQKGVLKVLIKP